MSHTGGQRIELRAICAIAAICALFLALLVSGAPHRLASAADGRAGEQHAARAMCHGGLLDANGGTPDAPLKKGARCPCCLAAHSAPAVLPDRMSVVLRQRPATPAVYRAFAAATPAFALSQAVNGARAPPAGLALS